jgi:hypothetical protein
MKSSPRPFIDKRRRNFLVAVYCLIASTCPAVVIISGTSLDTEVNPNNGLPWEQVARVTNADGSHVSSGSAVYLGGGYLLTADHVSLGQGYVSFDGSNTFAIRPGSGMQVGDGVDLKIFQLTTDPGLAGVSLLPASESGMENSSLGYLVGWGVGADPADDFSDSEWTWGSAAETSQKRWGTNWVFGATSSLSYSGYNYAALATRLGTDALPLETESAAGLYDSGGGLFIGDGFGGWYLMGIATAVSTNGSSAFGIEAGSTTSGDLNFFARIGLYENDILSEMTDPIKVPEAYYTSFAFGAVALVLVLIRRRRISP